MEALAFLWEELPSLTNKSISTWEIVSGTAAFIIAMTGLYFFYFRALLRKISGGDIPGLYDRRVIKWWVIGAYLFFVALAFAFWINWKNKILEQEHIYSNITMVEQSPQYCAGSTVRDLLRLCDSLSVRIPPSCRATLLVSQNRINTDSDSLRQALGVLTGHLKTRLQFYSEGADAARAIYETRSIVSYAGTIAVAAFAIVLPLLVALWNQARSTLQSRLNELIRLRGTPIVREPDLLNRQIARANRELFAGDHRGNSFRALYVAAILFGLVFTVLLILATFTRWSPFIDYVFSVTLQGAIWLGFMWLIVLLTLYQVMVQPIVRNNRTFAVFGREFENGNGLIIDHK